MPDTAKEATEQYTYTFVKWLPEIAEVTKDQTYTAVYEATPVQYTVLFRDDDKTVIVEKDYDYGKTYVTP